MAKKGFATQALTWPGPILERPSLARRARRPVHADVPSHTRTIGDVAASKSEKAVGWTGEARRQTSSGERSGRAGKAEIGGSAHRTRVGPRRTFQTRPCSTALPQIAALTIKACKSDRTEKAACRFQIPTRVKFAN